MACDGAGGDFDLTYTAGLGGQRLVSLVLRLPAQPIAWPTSVDERVDGSGASVSVGASILAGAPASAGALTVHAPPAPSEPAC